ncbi:hypothetical protein EW145_g8482 [Phellinidium pouzarii]|uniref:Uncharacterized protein n=1 Tax=Phellinidium pouzarii TaxID=167371 RepID=A0A4S4K5Q6_9AGAM|nr:hypothetical protein EW145_g8482 [Phellinidium pouzarii]
MNFLRTNKVKYVKQLTNVERRQTNLDRIDDRIKEALSHVYQESQESNSDDDPPDRVSRYHMGCKGIAFHLHRWLHQHRFDPATKNFYVLLLDHLLARMMGRDPDDELVFSDEERRSVVIRNDRIYQLKRLQNHYTTYDLQQKYDSINPTSSNSDIMVLSQDSDPEQCRLCPFWYARVICVFHTEVHWKNDPYPRRVDFLWVRWFGRDTNHAFGDDTCRLEHIRFVTEEDGSDPFGFIDPSSVVRAVHLIPCFHSGRTQVLLGASALARVKEPGCVLDWESFYVNKFADRDLFMHHRGGGVGHTTTFNSTLANHVPDGFHRAAGVMSSENIFKYENGVPDNLESEDDLDDSEMLDGSGADGCAADSSTAGSDVDIDISEY